MHAPVCGHLPRTLSYNCCTPGRFVFAKRLSIAHRLVACAKDNQKNEGVYFEYEPIDPDAGVELDFEDNEEEMFGWAQRSRDNKRAMQQKHKAIDREMSSGGRGGNRGRGRKGDKRGRGPSGQRRPAAGSDGPVLPSFSPVETPAMHPRAVTPEELLVRPRSAAAAAAAAAGDRPAAGAAGAAEGPDPATRVAAEQSFAGPALTPAAAPAPGSQPASASGLPAEVSGSVSGPASVSGADVEARDSGVVASSSSGPAAAGAGRRQRLLQRMKGGVAEPVKAVASASAAAAVGTAGLSRSGSAAVEDGRGTASTSAAPAAHTQQHADGTPDGGPRFDVASEAEATGTAAEEGVSPAALEADLRRQLASLASQLPDEAALPEDARPARALLQAILGTSGEDAARASYAAGDMAEMLQRDLTETREFQTWQRRAAADADAGRGGEEAQQGLDGGGDEGLSEAEAADLVAALANLDLEMGEGGVLDPDLEEALREAEGAGGDEAVGAALREVAEMRRLMAALDAAEGAEAGAGADAGEREMTDEQVLAALRTRDPALYELLKDVPDFDKLDLDLDLDLEEGQLTEAELAEMAEEEAGGGGGGGAELEALLREMRGMGLVRADGAAYSDDDADAELGGEDDDDDDEDGDEDGEDGLGLGDLLEAVGEDEALDPTTRLRAQFALQSMFNQPADELAAKGARGGGGGGGEEDGGVEEGKAAGRGGAAAAPPPPPRSTTGAARAAVRPDDEDGGAAPPPLLQRPRPKRR